MEDVTKSVVTVKDQPIYYRRDDKPRPDMVLTIDQLRDIPRTDLHQLFGTDIRNNDW